MASPTRIRWKTDSALSTLHAARCVAMGIPITDPKLEESFVPFVTAVNERLLAVSVNVAAFWNRMVDETLNSESLANETLTRSTEIALVDSGCSELQADQTGRAVIRQIDDCRLAIQKRFPRLEDQLELRARPLQDHWDSVGPGLLKQIAKQIWQDVVPKKWWPPRASALLVQPMRGGDGGFDASDSKIWIEAMLTNANPKIPEVLRVAWLITRIAIEQHLSTKSADKSSESKSGLLKSSDMKSNSQTGLADAWTLASIAITLQAASRLELTPSQPLSIAEAISLWRISENPALGNLINDWWGQYREHPLPLPVALKSLAQSLQSSPSPLGSQRGLLFNARSTQQ